MLRTLLMGAVLLSAGCPKTDLSRDISRDSGTDDGGLTDAANLDTAPADGSTGNQPCINIDDCVLTSISCCGSCGVPSTTDMIAVHRDNLDAHRGQACSDPVPCPACAGPRDPYLVATCRAGQCEAVDLRNETTSGCDSDSDCRLRANACCECGAEINQETVMSYNIDSTAALDGLLCDAANDACPECAPSYAGMMAFCDQTGEIGECDVHIIGF